MPEGRVYLCSYEKTGKAIRLWVKSRPKVQGRGKTYEEAEEKLLDNICMHYNDGEAVLEFDPPLPESPQVVRFLNPAIVSVTGNTTPDFYGPLGSDFTKRPGRHWEPPLGELYSGGICRKCKNAFGDRTSVPLEISVFESGYEGAFCGDIQIFSERFLALLKPREKRGLEFRPVHRRERSRRQFFELIAKPSIPYVAVKGLKFAGWQCGTCGVRSFGFYGWGFELNEFVAKMDLPSPLPTCFTIGTGNDLDLCFTRKRWQELARQPGARGIVSAPIGVVEESECIRNPKLPRYKKR
jgi:hypothetical protein